MYLLNLWDKDDEFKQTPQISFTCLNQGFPDAELFGAFVMRYRLELILSFPLIAFIMAMYLNLAFKEDGVAQAPEKLWKERPLMAASFFCLVLMVILMNVSLPWFTNLFQQSIFN